MVQAVNNITQVNSASQPQVRPADPPSRYATDWAGSTAARPVTLSQAGVALAAPAGGSIGPSNARARESAALSAAVYNDNPNPPPAGFRNPTAADLARLNLTPAMLERPGSSFRARVYVAVDGAETRYVVAFRGSSQPEDWKNNAQQLLGRNSESYAKALEIGRALSRSGETVNITGHSLGGGLASCAAIAGGRQADTFNAAGLSDRTLREANAISATSGRGGTGALVQAYRVHGEILTFMQEGGDRLLGGLLGGLPGAAAANAPAAYGTHVELPDVAPAGKTWFQEHSRADRHMIDWVVAQANALPR